jgi:dUTP pyrophosphatase
MKCYAITEDAIQPRRGSEGSAGYDLYAAESVRIPPGQRRLVSTDIAVECPEGCYARIAPRSGLALKNGIDVMAGVIDRDYTGPVEVLLINLSGEDFKIHQGDRIAQMIFERCVVGKEIGLHMIHGLPDETTRGNGGFGSTGR